jgi:hypothetical protein
MINNPYFKYNPQTQQNTAQNNFEYMKYVDYYNPAVIQNYYAMLSQMNPMNFNSYFAQPYTMQNHHRYRNLPTYHHQTPPQPLDEETQKWINSRKRNFPTKIKIDEKQTIGKIKEDAGMLSKLEQKLREKIKIISKFDKRGNYKQNKVRKQRPRRKRPNRKNDEPEDGEILETPSEEPNNIQSEKPRKPENKEKKEKPNQKHRKYFRYRRSRLYEEMIKSDKFKELNIILQAFRYFVNESLI